MGFIFSKTSFDVCLGSFSCWNIKLCPSFSHLAIDLRRSSFFIVPYMFCNVPIQMSAKQPKSMMLPPPAARVFLGKVSPLLLQEYNLTLWLNNLIFVSSDQKPFLQKAFGFYVYTLHLRMKMWVLEQRFPSWLAPLPSMVL